MTKLSLLALLLVGPVGCGGGGSEIPTAPGAGDAADGDADGDADAEAGPDAGADPDVDTDTETDTDTDTDTNTDAPDAEGCPSIFAQDVLATFRVDIDEGDWQALRDEHDDLAGRQDEPPRTWFPVVFRTTTPAGVEEVREDAAIRLKGTTANWSVGDKLQFVIAFNLYDPDGRLLGLRKLALDAPPWESTLLRERLGLSYLRDLGLPAACANNARLEVNGEYYGLFVSIERIDREFLERNFEDPDGNLHDYACELRTNEDEGVQDRCWDFWEIGDVGELEAMADMDEALAEWAAEAVIPHGDGYWAGSWNFFLYDDPARGFVFIPHDLDYSFDAVETHADPIEWQPKWGEKGRHFELVIDDPESLERYVEAVGIAVGSFDAGALQDRLDAWSAQIAEALRDDPNRDFGFDDHLWAVESLRAYLPERADFVAGWLAEWEGQR